MLRVGHSVGGRLDEVEHLMRTVARGVEVKAALGAVIRPLSVASKTADITDIPNKGKLPNMEIKTVRRGEWVYPLPLG